MAALDDDALLIGPHRMIYATNVPHYWVERPDRKMYQMEQMIHSVTAQPGTRYIIGKDRREINHEGPFDIHYMITRKDGGWTRETVVFRSGDSSPYPVDVNTYEATPQEEPPVNEEDVIRRMVIHSSYRAFEVMDVTPSFWDEVKDDEEINAEELEEPDDAEFLEEWDKLPQIA